VAAGDVASIELARLLFESGAMPEPERTRLREALRRYCALDTLGVVRLLERLEALAPRHAGPGRAPARPGARTRLRARPAP
jgi:hypothetical protein